mmetsp:Transcript_1722/g.5204  ORF Transcript_1722/g.5204 Transcript_1722/m.5204 type:complete len:228 (+) Transcript_1722:533-1216(+)
MNHLSTNISRRTSSSLNLRTMLGKCLSTAALSVAIMSRRSGNPGSNIFLYSKCSMKYINMRNASSSTDALTRNRAQIEDMPWQYPTSGTAAAYARRTLRRLLRPICAPPAQKSSWEGIVLVTSLSMSDSTVLTSGAVSKLSYRPSYASLSSEIERRHGHNFHRITWGTPCRASLRRSASNLDSLHWRSLLSFWASVKAFHISADSFSSGGTRAEPRVAAAVALARDR